MSPNFSKFRAMMSRSRQPDPDSGSADVPVPGPASSKQVKTLTVSGLITLFPGVHFLGRRVYRHASIENGKELNDGSPRSSGPPAFPSTFKFASFSTPIPNSQNDDSGEDSLDQPQIDLAGSFPSTEFKAIDILMVGDSARDSGRMHMIPISPGSDRYSHSRVYGNSGYTLGPGCTDGASLRTEVKNIIKNAWCAQPRGDDWEQELKQVWTPHGRTEIARDDIVGPLVNAVLDAAPPLTEQDIIECDTPVAWSSNWQADLMRDWKSETADTNADDSDRQIRKQLFNRRMQAHHGSLRELLVDHALGCSQDGILSLMASAAGLSPDDVRGNQRLGVLERTLEREKVFYYESFDKVRGLSGRDINYSTFLVPADNTTEAVLLGPRVSKPFSTSRYVQPEDTDSSGNAIFHLELSVPVPSSA